MSLVPLRNLQEWYFNIIKQRIALGLNKCIVHKAIRNLLRQERCVLLYEKEKVLNALLSPKYLVVN